MRHMELPYPFLRRIEGSLRAIQSDIPFFAGRHLLRELTQYQPGVDLRAYKSRQRRVSLNPQLMTARGNRPSNTRLLDRAAGSAHLRLVLIAWPQRIHISRANSHLMMNLPF